MNPAIYQQQHDHTCGAACVRMVMDHFGRVPLSERTLARKLHAKFKMGIEPWRIERYFQHEGFRAEYRQEKKFGALYDRFLNGWMPIVCWGDWGGHYCIVTEVQLDKRIWSGGRMVLADPAATYEAHPNGLIETSVDRFKALWFNPLAKEKHEAIYVRA